jgi:hypothetical protein
MSLSLLLLSACRPEAPAKDDGQNTPPDSGTTLETGTPEVLGMEDFALSVDPDVVLMVHARFTDPGSTGAWVEYRFETSDWLVAPTTASGEAVLLGIPEQTRVEARAVAVVDSAILYSPVASATTGSLPPQVLRPDVVTFEAGLASPEPWALVSVATGTYTYQGPYFLELFDRAGRVVWYHEVPDDLFSFYPSVARDGTHLWYDAQDIFGFAGGPPRVTRRTLDGRWEVTHPTPSAGQAYAEGPDGSFFYEVRGGPRGVAQVDASGASSLVWDCEAHLTSIGLSGGDCPLNACNWDEARGTLLASQFETSTVFEIDLASGSAVRQFGALTEGDPYRFVPSESGFAYQHWPHWTPEGTLFVSTHLPCVSGPDCNGNRGLEGTQVAAEYVVDDAAKTITRIWSHTSTDRWATQVGEAYRLPNGNVVQGYGQDGAVREVTPGGETAWDVEWPRDGGGFRVVGHLSLVADLYALNRGG